MKAQLSWQLITDPFSAATLSLSLDLSFLPATTDNFQLRKSPQFSTTYNLTIRNNYLKKIDYVNLHAFIYSFSYFIPLKKI